MICRRSHATRILIVLIDQVLQCLRRGVELSDELSERLLASRRRRASGAFSRLQPDVHQQIIQRQVQSDANLCDSGELGVCAPSRLNLRYVGSGNIHAARNVLLRHPRVFTRYSKVLADSFHREYLLILTGASNRLTDAILAK